MQRRARARGDVLSVSLVGYTNAGKSTLFNALTHAKAYEADQLFATLDTTTRRVWLPEAGNVVVSDTVGFIRDLPHGLVAAFRATLEETVHADLLLHVVDARLAGARRAGRRGGQGAGRDRRRRRPAAPGLEQDRRCRAWSRASSATSMVGFRRVFVSARTGAGLDGLRGAIAEAARTRQARSSFA